MNVKKATKKKVVREPTKRQLALLAILFDGKY
jgi:hypothetical protein